MTAMTDTEHMNTTESNPIDDFMLKEYESIASAHFDSQAGLRQQFRFYLIIAAVPVTVLGLAFRDRPEREIQALTFFDLPTLLTTVFLAIGVLGFLLLFSMIHTALDATMYARTVNGIRNYFVERAKDRGKNIEPYLVMPFNKKRPKYFHMRAFLLAGNFDFSSKHILLCSVFAWHTAKQTLSVDCIHPAFRNASCGLLRLCLFKREKRGFRLIAYSY